VADRNPGKTATGETRPASIRVSGGNVKKLSIVVPVYNERRTLVTILKRVLSVNLGRLERELVIVDDCSTDGTRDLVREIESSGLKLFEGHGVPKKRLEGVTFECRFHEVNSGKGSALRTGFDAVSGDIVIVQDADLEYDPNDYPRLLAPILQGNADVVYGSRFAGDTRKILFFWHSLGNQALTFLSNAFTNLNLTDMETCYKVFRAEVIKDLNLKSERFGIEPEITAKIAKLRYRLYEVPISYHGRSYAEGKKIGVKDGLEALYSIIRFSVFDSDYVKGGVVEETLSKMNALETFNTHLFETISPYLGKRILEVGAGTGNITRFLLGRGDVTATDLNRESVSRLRQQFSGYEGFEARTWDISKRPSKALREGGYDTVVSLNVLEHIEDHETALENKRLILEQTGGRLVLLVPADMALYSGLDQGLGHFRRYGRTEVEGLLQCAGFEVEEVFNFNLLGMLGWLLNGKVLKRDRLPSAQLGLYELVAPLALAMEKRIDLPRGLSLVAIARPRQ